MQAQQEKEQGMAFPSGTLWRATAGTVTARTDFEEDFDDFDEEDFDDEFDDDFEEEEDDFDYGNPDLEDDVDDSDDFDSDDEPDESGSFEEEE